MLSWLQYGARILFDASNCRPLLPDNLTNHGAWDLHFFELTFSVIPQLLCSRLETATALPWLRCQLLVLPLLRTGLPLVPLMGLPLVPLMGLPLVPLMGLPLVPLLMPLPGQFAFVLPRVAATARAEAAEADATRPKLFPFPFGFVTFVS